MIDNLAIVIQARMSSTRMQGKVMQPIWEGHCLLDLQLKQLKKLDIPVILATTTNPADAELEHWARKNGISVFRGDEQNVLKRFIDCATSLNAEHLIRVCSDNPFLQTAQIQDFLDGLDNGNDYISLSDASGIPAIKKHWGLFVEGVRLSALKQANNMLETHPKKDFYREHVTNFIYGNPDEFGMSLPQAPEEIVHRNDLRFTIDTQDDFKNMQRLLLELEGDTSISLSDLVNLVDGLPEVKNVMRKGIQAFSK